MLLNTHDWFWEGNVQARLAQYLEQQGWRTTVVNTATKQKGVDVVATKGERKLALEVKGYPAAIYATGAKAGLPKPKGQAHLQAKLWYADVLLAAILLRSKGGYTDVGIGLPEHPQYRELLKATEDALRLLGIGLYLVTEEGDVFLAVEHGHLPAI